MVALEESQSNPVSWLKSLTLKLVKEFHPRQSVVVCKPTRGARMGLSRTEAVMMMDHAISVGDLGNGEHIP
jgi:hypothetical protein